MIWNKLSVHLANLLMWSLAATDAWHCILFECSLLWKMTLSEVGIVKFHSSLYFHTQALSACDYLFFAHLFLK